MNLTKLLQPAAAEKQPANANMEPLTREETAEYVAMIGRIEAAFAVFAPAVSAAGAYEDPAEPLHTFFYKPVNLGSVGERPAVWAQACKQQHRVPNTDVVLSTKFELSFAEPLPQDLSDRPLPSLTGRNSRHLRTKAFSFGVEVPVTRGQLDEARSFAQLLGFTAEQLAAYQLACAGAVAAGEQPDQPAG